MEQVPRDEFDELLRAELGMVREQVEAAWQLHVERVKEQLDAAWREHVGKALEDRAGAMGEAVRREVERRVTDTVQTQIDGLRAEARRLMSERLNQSARRLEQSEGTASWASALLDGAHAFAAKVVLFRVSNGELAYEGHRAPEGVRWEVLAEMRVPMESAAAAMGVKESLDTVIAMATARELSAPLANVLGESEERRVCLVPICVGRSEEKRRVAAILYADGNGVPLDVSVLELLASLAGTTLECRQAKQKLTTQAAAGAVMSIAPAHAAVAAAAPPVAAASSMPATSPVAAETAPVSPTELTARAQRFARVRVAEMRLYQAQAVREGRESRDLYTALKDEIDRSRAQFKQDFLDRGEMPDYLHLETLRTLAYDDEGMLGPGYPGPQA
jgi:hypothetical protein